jgi:hypothetical protein
MTVQPQAEHFFDLAGPTNYCELLRSRQEHTYGDKTRDHSFDAGKFIEAPERLDGELSLAATKLSANLI